MTPALHVADALDICLPQSFHSKPQAKPPISGVRACALPTADGPARLLFSHALNLQCLSTVITIGQHDTIIDEDAAYWITQDFNPVDELCVACRRCHLHRLTWLWSCQEGTYISIRLLLGSSSS